MVYKFTKYYKIAETTVNETQEVEEIKPSEKKIIKRVGEDEEKEDESVLSQIANIFNNGKARDIMNEQGYIAYAKAKDDRIDMSVGQDHIRVSIEFILEDNILYIEVFYDEIEPMLSAAKMMASILVADCVGALKGYPEGALIKAVTKENAKNFTIENEGIEIRQLNSEQSGMIKIDLKSDLPFLKN